MTLIVDLPTEIFQQIDHFLCSVNDRITCMSVCSKWYLLFRKSLFHWVRIHSRHQFTQFYPNLVNYGHLVKLIDIQQPFDEMDSIIELDELIAICKHCPQLHTLHFNAWDQLCVYYPYQTRQLVSSLKSIASLSGIDPASNLGHQILQQGKHLRDVSLYVDTQDGFHWLQGLTNLACLTLNLTGSNMAITDFEKIHQSCPHLRSLAIFGNSGYYPTNAEDHASLPTAIEPASSMRSLRLMHHVRTTDQTPWVRYICNKYPALHTLDIESDCEPYRNHHEADWEPIIAACPHLTRLSLFGLPINPEFFRRLLQHHPQGLKTLKLFSPSDQPVPLTQLLHKYQHSLNELTFWPCHILQTITLNHCRHLSRLTISGIHMRDDWLSLPLDSLIHNIPRLQQLTLDHLTLCTGAVQQPTQLMHVALSHVTLADHTLSLLCTVSPRLTHLSLVSCQFLNTQPQQQQVEIRMPHHRLEFFNLHHPYISGHASVSSSASPHASTIAFGVVQHHATQYYYHHKKKDHRHNNNDQKTFIYITLHCFSVDQLYLFGSRINNK